ncbi:MAG TPA: hypothetical protein VJR89_34575 [Polyangiales bacterium]|nr:hypothetical protein [Polyangiales bacterium]
MIPRPLARRIDRLARRAHAFHRFAHHPLCDRYAGELIHLRRQRVCRGCACALLGAALGSLSAVVAPLPVLPALLATAVALAASLVALRRGFRPGKLWSRALPAGLIAHAGIAALLAGELAAACAVLAALGVLARVYRTRGPDRTPCSSCPERTREVPCSGFRDIVRAERAFVRRSRQLLDSRA